jgi:hypothetical protein
MNQLVLMVEDWTPMAVITTVKLAIITVIATEAAHLKQAVAS